jgi:hypothetical protein
LRGKALLPSAALLFVPVLAGAGQLKLRETKKHSMVVELPGGSATLTLLESWGRTREPNKAWKAEGEKLPAVKARGGKGWVEVTLAGKVARDSFIEIHRFQLDPSAAKGWDRFKNGILVRRGRSTPFAKPLAETGDFLKRWAWPCATGLTRLRRKTISTHSMGAQEVWTGFAAERFKGAGKSLPVVDAGAIALRNRGGQVLALVANRALAVGYDGPKLSISAVARDLRGGEERPLRVRVYLGKGKAEELLENWWREVDDVPVRVFFCGDSVGAAKGSYASVLAGRLRKEFGAKARCVNTSRGGDTTAGALKEYRENVLDHRPQIAVFQLCYNDVGKIKPDAVAANLKKMIDPLLAGKGGRALVMTPLSYDKKRVDAYLKKGVDINQVHAGQYIPALKKLVAAYEADPKTKGKVGFANIWEAMAKVRKEKGADYVLLPDGSHPVKEGHGVIADCACPELKRLVTSALKEVAK